MKENKTYKAVLETARKNYGVFTVADLKKKGVSPEAVRQFAINNDDVEHYSKGVYTFYGDPDDKISYAYTDYARAVAAGGKDAFLYGDTVLGMLNLATACPPKNFVAVPRYTTNAKSAIKKIRYNPHPGEITKYLGLPCQTLKHALIHSTEVPKYRLLEAADWGVENNYLSLTDKEEVANILWEKYGAI
jgi:hypothetical protein